jgi:hypothetical protein
MVRVASYNCQQSQRRALRFLTQTAVADDVACTQESGTRLSLGSYIASTPNFRSAHGYLNDGCVVVTTTLERVSASTDIRIRAGSNNNRSALLVRLRRGLIVVNVHLTSGNRPRARRELAHIVAHIDQRYRNSAWLIIGDFNHDPTANYPAPLYVAEGPAHEGGWVLDWAISNRPLDPYTYPRYFGSDHAPWGVDVDVG